MATVFSHPMVAICCFPWFTKMRGHSSIMVAGIVLTILPDFDVVGFYLDIPYEHVLGHRGITHSLFFAFIVSGMVARYLCHRTRVEIKLLWLYLFSCLSSHGIIDAFTNGGLGIALFAPFSTERYFFPWQPLEVSPIGIHPFLSKRGLSVILNELLWIWLPCFAIWLCGRKFRKTIGYTGRGLRPES